MVYKPRRERRAAGGKAGADTEPLPKEKWNQYNAKGSPEEKEESAESDGFKRGGRAKRKDGGHVEGDKAKSHLGKRARGGATEQPREGKEMESKEDTRPERAKGGSVMARGGAPFSSDHKTKPPTEDRESGPGEQAPMVP